MPPLSFSIATSGEPTEKAWRECARAAEGLGYHSLVLNDHCGQSLAPLPALAFAASVTDSLRLGTHVLNSDIRNPVLLAQEAITLDLLSNGRMTLGIGAGWVARDYSATGVPRLPGPQRAHRLIEAVQLLSGLLSGEAMDFTGSYFRVHLDEPLPLSVQRPRVPLLIGAARQRLLTYAARHAEAISITGSSSVGGDNLEQDDLAPERLNEKIGWIKAAAGPRFSAIQLDHVIWECYVTPNPAPVLDVYARAMGMEPARVRDLPWLLAGTLQEVCDTILARREQWGITSFTIPVGAMRQFAPVVARLAGR